MTTAPSGRLKVTPGAAREARVEYEQKRHRHRLLLGAGLFVCIAASVAAWVWIRPGRVQARAAESGAVSSELMSVLQQLRGGIAQSYVGTVVPPTLTAERCERELPAVLADHAGPLFLPAVLLADHFKIASLVPLLRAAMPVPDADTNRVLVLAIEHLDPWSDADVNDMLASESPAVVAAALSVCTERPAVLLDKAVWALCSKEPEVRASALAVLPKSLAKEVGEALAIQLQWVPPEDAREALEALLRCAETPAIERLMYERLAEHGPACDLALLALTQAGRRLAEGDVVLAIALDTSRPVLTRSRALYCLERTGTNVTSEALTSLWPQHPALDYFAARLLLITGHSAGVQMLLRILDCSDEDEPGQRLVTEARIGARQLLADLTDTSAYEDPAVWKEWATTMPKPSVSSLSPPRIELDMPTPPR